jgi:hypothetical protein
MKMNTDRIEHSFANDREDDLLAISGVGPGYAEALKRINIRRYADFSAYGTNLDLHQALVEAGQNVPLWKITKFDWVGKAKELAGEEAGGEPTPPEESETEQLRHASAAGWAQYAGFNVYFEHSLEGLTSRNWHTVVYKSLEPDGFNDKQIFPGIEPEVWVEWIMSRAELPHDAKPPAFERRQTGEPMPQPPPIENRIAIGDITVAMLPPSSEYPERRLNTNVRFSLIGAGVQALAANHAPFRVEIHAMDVEAGTSALVASSQGQFQPEITEYASNQAFPLPDVGRYDIYGLVLLLPPAEMVACRQGPTIRIVP